MKKEKIICAQCGSEEIAKDAFATWNFQNQEWELHSTYDTTKCLNEDCEADDSGKWINIEVPDPQPVPGVYNANTVS